MNIREFKKGDNIVRTKPAKPLSNSEDIEFMGMKMGSRGGGGDRSYMGNEMEFVGIGNGMIYCKNKDKFHLSMFGDKLTSLAEDIWQEGWEFWIDPLSLGDVDYNVKEARVKRAKDQLKMDIQQAIEIEAYELVDELKEKLRKLENS